MKHHHIIILFALLFSIPPKANCQQQVGAPGIREFNFTSFTPKSNKIINQELLDLTGSEFYTHPEFGILPLDAPCTDCIEILDKRTSNTKYYVKKGTNGQKFYSEASNLDLHYRNDKGEIITIDPRLSADKINVGIYKAEQQPDPTELNMIEGYTAMQLMEKTIFKFNQGLTIYSTDDFVTFDNIDFINRTNYTAGDDGAYITNAFGQIDQQLIFGEALIKSSYLINDLSSINTSKKFFVIEDEFILPDGFELKQDIYEGLKNDYDFWFGDLILENKDGIELARIDAPIIYDSNSSDSVLIDSNIANNISYSIEKTGNVCKLKMIIETAWLSSPSRVFPIIVDPTVFGATTTWTGVSGTDDSPNFCTVSLSVPTPAMATFTGSSIFWEFEASGVSCAPFCKMKFLQVYITTGCSVGASGFCPGPGDPLLLLGGVWICPGCNAPGTWNPTIDDASSASLVSCYPPNCAAGSIPFTIHHNQFQCVTPGGCVNTCAFLKKFIVTVEGETVTATALAEGATAYTVLNCADQSGYLSASTPNYGVPGYTYTWTPGPLTGSPVFVVFPMGVTVYTLTITDACGNTATDNVTVTNNCLLLPIDLLSFSGYNQDKKNYLNWVTASEKNNSGFIIERSPTGLQFEPIGSVDGNGNSQQNSNYGFIDNDPFEGVNYYRLKQVDENEEFSYSNIIAINSGEVTSTHVIVNNEKFEGNTLDLTIFSTTAGQSDIFIYDMTGAAIASHKLYVGAGANTVNLQVPSLAKGVYILSFLRGVETAETKFIY